MSQTAEIQEGTKFFIKWDQTHETLTLLFPEQDPVGSGAWKKCFSSTTVAIPLNAKKESQRIDSVWTEVNSGMNQEVEIATFLYDRWMQEKPAGVYLLKPWEKIHSNVYAQRRLSNKIEFKSPVEKAVYFLDIATALAWIHEQKVIHGDVYFRNTLMEERIDGEGKLQKIPYLTDFGSARKWGASSIRKLDDYVRSDPCKCFADINTPLTDWHGFIITSIVSWFPEMTAPLKWDKFISIRKTVFDDECAKNSRAAESYWIDPRPFTEIRPLEQRAWNLWITICKKSAQLYLCFEDKTGEITAHEIELKMAEIQAEDISNECLKFAHAMKEFARPVLPN